MISTADQCGWKCALRSPIEGYPVRYGEPGGTCCCFVWEVGRTANPQVPGSSPGRGRKSNGCNRPRADRDSNRSRGPLLGRSGHWQSHYEVIGVSDLRVEAREKLTHPIGHYENFPVMATGPFMGCNEGILEVS